MERNTLSGRVFWFILCCLLVPGKGQAGSGNVPMSNPDDVLAIHEHKYGYSVSFVELADGRILWGTNPGREFMISEDKGLSWSEPYRGKDEDGQPLSHPMRALVRLSDGAVGMAYNQYVSDSGDRTVRRICQIWFRRSEDEGRTWSEPVLVSDRTNRMHMLPDTLLRTSSGRIILPAYCMFGQWRYGQRPEEVQEGAPRNVYYVREDSLTAAFSFRRALIITTNVLEAVLYSSATTTGRPGSGTAMAS